MSNEIAYDIIGFLFVIIIIVVFIIILLIFIYKPINQSQTQGFSITLNGAQEVPPSTSTGVGSGKLNLSALGTYLDYDIAISGIATSVIAVTFNQGAFGQNGSVLKNANFTNIGNGNYIIQGSWTAADFSQPLTANIVTQLKSGNLYMNVMSQKDPNGEIRGQIIPLLL